MTSSSCTTGITTTEAIPISRQTSRFTRASRSASSQRKGLRVRTLSPDSPNSVESSAPSSGAFSPLLARHSMSFFPRRRKAIAAPLDPVMYWARSARSCKAASRSRCAISAMERPPSSPGKRTEDSSAARAPALAAVSAAETLAWEVRVALPCCNARSVCNSTASPSTCVARGAVVVSSAEGGRDPVTVDSFTFVEMR